MLTKNYILDFIKLRRARCDLYCIFTVTDRSGQKKTSREWELLFWDWNETGFSTSFFSGIGTVLCPFSSPDKWLPLSLKSLPDSLILTPPPHLTLNLPILGGSNLAGVIIWHNNGTRFCFVGARRERFGKPLLCHPLTHTHTHTHTTRTEIGDRGVQKVTFRSSLTSALPCNFY